MDTQSLADLLNQRYGAHVEALHSLSLGSRWAETRIYRVERAHGLAWIVRVYARASYAGDPAHHIAVLRFLERHAYPTERLVAASDAAAFITTAAQLVLVTTEVEGRALGYEPQQLYQLGEALGRLHALSTPGTRSADAPLGAAAMRPAPEIAWALEQLRSVAGSVPPPLRERYDALVAALRAVHDCEDLPGVVIHNDVHPANAVYTPDGHAVLVDWDGAGIGPAVLDVGFLLISCDTESPWTPPLPPNPARVAAVIDGYCRHHTLSARDLERLPDALRFRALVFGAGELSRVIAEGGQIDARPWWWARYLSADDVAARARACFERYL